MNASEAFLNAEEDFLNAEESFLNAEEVFLNAAEGFPNADERLPTAAKAFLNAVDGFLRAVEVFRSVEDVLGSGSQDGPQVYQPPYWTRYTWAMRSLLDRRMLEWIAVAAAAILVRASMAVQEDVEHFSAIAVLGFLIVIVLLVRNIGRDFGVWGSDDKSA